MTGNRPDRSRPLRVGNASGFYGDRFSAIREMLDGGPLDVLTGDYLAELTMLILGRSRMKDPTAGYAGTFLRQMEDCLGLAVERGVRIVTNAGGLNPAGLARALADLAGRLGITVAIGHVEGDDLLARTGELGLGDPLTANAYLGAWGITECLRGGAQVVVTGRVTDASLLVGPAAWWFDWAPGDLDPLAGATAAGHVLECGTQATGGNYAFFTELADPTHPGFPLAEVHPDGSSVITKHPGTGGAVTVETVTAQLLYEIDTPAYVGPDVVTRFDTIRLTQQGPDRVRLDGVRGAPPPTTVKVCLNTLGGFRNSMTFVLTGLDVPAKADLVRRQMEHALGRAGPADLVWTLARTDHADPPTEQTAGALLTVTARDPDRARAGRAFSRAGIELALASYPGFHVTAPPGEATPYGVYSAGFVPQGQIAHVAVLPDGRRVAVPPPERFTPVQARPEPVPSAPTLPEPPRGPTRRVPLGRLVGARSGDKGGTANLGVWARTDAAWPWLAHTLTAGALRDLLPELAPLPVTRHVLANLRALNFVVDGLLEQGVSSATRFDPQAKALGEWLRSRHADVPEVLL
ncbi:MAG TPA: acyclic terpene utilization AtuA family protein [Mycobacteriales bacterium]|nr:acyclic terpene utilization AtuA family protein [Mycobacteriales bacterium]